MYLHICGGSARYPGGLLGLIPKSIEGVCQISQGSAGDDPQISRRGSAGFCKGLPERFPISIEGGLPDCRRVCQP